MERAFRASVSELGSNVRGEGEKETEEGDHWMKVSAQYYYMTEQTIGGAR